MKIKSKRFILKKINHTKIGNQYLNWFKDKQVKKYIEKIPNNLFELKEFVKKTNKEKNCFFFGIYEKNLHLGNIKISNVNFANRSAELGILIGEKNYRGKGVGFEVIEVIKKFLIKKQIFKIFLGLKKSNKIAYRLYRNCGFKTHVVKEKTIVMECNLISSKIILGGAQFRSNYGITNLSKRAQSKNHLKDIISLLKKRKINHIDAAENYEYFSEKNKLLINNFEIDTKINIDEITSYQTLKNQILKKYFVSGAKVDTLYIHNGDFVLKKLKYEKFNILKKLKSEKIINKIGISIYNFRNLKNIFKSFKFDVVQMPYNLLDRRLENYQKYLKKKDVLIYVRSIFLQGILLKKINHNKKFINIYKKVRNKGKQINMTNLSMCLGFVLNNDLIDKIIIGVRSSKELSEIMNCKVTTKNIKINFNKSEIKFGQYPNKWKFYGIK